MKIGSVLKRISESFGDTISVYLIGTEEMLCWPFGVCELLHVHTPRVLMPQSPIFVQRHPHTRFIIACGPEQPRCIRDFDMDPVMHSFLRRRLSA